MYQAGADKKYQRTANDQPVGLLISSGRTRLMPFPIKGLRSVRRNRQQDAEFYAKCSGCGGLHYDHYWDCCF